MKPDNPLRIQEETDKELIALYENAPLIMVLVDGERRFHKVNAVRQHSRTDQPTPCT